MCMYNVAYKRARYIGDTKVRNCSGLE